jgi:hypothetical protein
MRALVVACAVAVLVAALFASAGDDEDMQPRPSSAIADGRIFSADAGDPVDVYYTRESPAEGCVNVGGSFYGSTISCFDPDTTEGSWQVLIPTTQQVPPLVVGVMPSNATGATVYARQARVRAQTRERWFLAALEVGSLGEGNDARVKVEFDSR